MSSLPQLLPVRPVPTIGPSGQGFQLRVADIPQGPDAQGSHREQQGLGLPRDQMRDRDWPPRITPTRVWRKGGWRGRLPCFQYLPSNHRHSPRSSREKDPDPSPTLNLQVLPSGVHGKQKHQAAGQANPGCLLVPKKAHPGACGLRSVSQPTWLQTDTKQWQP